MRIILADDGIHFDGFTLSQRALGGAETAFISLAEALSARGHDVTVINNCTKLHENNGVKWQPIGRGFPDSVDIYIANRGHRLIGAMPRAKRNVFWVHNPAGYLLKWRYLLPLWRINPVIVFSGAYHLATCPAWVPSAERVVIPCGIEDRFLEVCSESAISRKRAIFTSNPLRSLNWLVDLWAQKIHPLSPDAELHLFAGPQTYGVTGDQKAQRMKEILDHAATLRNKGIILRGPVPKAQLIEEMKIARVMPYRGDIGETFCLALAESQAMGIPCVVQDIGCVAERIVDGETGFVTDDDDLFARYTANLLNDNSLWLRQHKAALSSGRAWNWDQVAQAFERLAQ
ncbi:glycosyltransferase family 4 protein [Thalassospira sp.]|uniref:glycosyltransferase family 4 protein n=1 Tax=Thalassospira sp. TaxID=1912094 RepID=UPI0027349C8C|nr:glycosyltransferase family 4 protein [Thalassospira sp.]MDP2696766.1 glycosyltransferase family 4 protein [Thalassospira sp.]